MKTPDKFKIIRFISMFNVTAFTRKIMTAVIMTQTWVICLLTAGDIFGLPDSNLFFGNKGQDYLPQTFIFMGRTCFIKLDKGQYRCGINCPSGKIC